MKSEKHLWKHLRPRLKGRGWRRLEAIDPPGMPDVVGFYGGQTVWIELKVGKPSVKKLEPGQYDFICDCLAEGVPVWVVFAHNGVLKWYPGLPFGEATRVPAFYSPLFSKPSKRADLTSS